MREKIKLENCCDFYSVYVYSELQINNFYVLIICYCHFISRVMFYSLNIVQVPFLKIECKDVLGIRILFGNCVHTFGIVI